MKAAVNKSYGPPSTLNITEIPKPALGTNEILINVHYSGVNRTDCGFLRAKPFVTRFFTGLINPKYASLGCEFAGIVDSVGSEVTTFAKGDKVFGFDDNNFGGYSEYKLIAEDKMVEHIPSKATIKQAAVSTEGAHYALFYIYRIRDVKNKKVFVNGATGAIGSAAVQILKERGAYVVASSTTAHMKAVKNLGADKVIDWQKDNITVLDQEFDVYLDAVGKSRFSKARKILKQGGIYMSSELGPFGQNPILSIINPIQRFFTKRNIAFPIPQTRKKEIIEIKRLLENGSYKPLIDREYPLTGIRQAFEYVESGQKTGNVIIKIS